jgi:uncharacterized membrane protein
MTGFVLGLLLFLGTHMVRAFAPDWRNQRIAASEAAYKGTYSLLSLAGFGLIVWFYGEAAGQSSVLYEPPAWMKHVNALLMLFAALSFGAYLFPAGRIKAALKHPMLLSVKIWALGHLLANGTTAALLLFGGFLAWGVLVRISIKKRERVGATTPMVAGPVHWDVAAVAAGLALYAAFVMGGHVWLFGVSPLPVG